MIDAAHGDAVGAIDLRQRVQDRLRQGVHPRGNRPEPGVMLADQMGQHLSVGRGLERVAGLQQLPLERLEILDHTVMNHGDAPALIQVRMCVFVGGRAMRGPAGVADAQRSCQRVSLQKPRQALLDLAFLLLNLQGTIVEDRHPGTVVTAIFEPPQAFEQDGRRLALADVAYNAAHNSAFISRPSTVCLIQCHPKPQRRISQ